MNYKHTFTLTLFTLLILINPSISSTSAITLSQNTDGNVDFENDNIHMRVTGNENVPKYEFWSVDETREKYRVQFGSMFEAIDSNDNGEYDLGTDSKVSGSSASLSSSSWDFTEVTEENGQVFFNMTSTSMGFEITFSNYIQDDTSSLKFDVIIDGYEFTSDEDNAILVLGFSLSSSGTNAGNDSEEANDNSVEFGEGIFEIEETAQDANGDIDVGLSRGNEGNSNNAYVSYGKFNGTLVHDPTIGLSGPNTLLLITGGVILVAVIGIIVYRQRYETIETIE